MTKRQPTKHIASFEERLAEEAQKFRQAAEREPMGSTARELLMRRARQAETAAHISGWLKSPELQPPVTTNEIHEGRMIPKRA
jgi:hypothetical protein